MKLYLKFLKYYLNIIAFFNSKYAGKIAIQVFQKITNKKIKPKETLFYKKAILKKLNGLAYYEMGNPKGELVLLVHGWNSNAGSLSRFAFELANNNYRVLSLDLPAHANSKGTHTNLFESKNALIKLIKHLNLEHASKINCIAHSFGSAVSVYAFSELNLSLNKMVLLTANNKMKEIFDDYQKLIGFNQKVTIEISKWVKKVLHKDLDELVLADNIKALSYNDLLIIHDKFDKVLPFNSALEIKEAIPKIKLIPFEKIGHYRMLWNEEVIAKTITFINK